MTAAAGFWNNTAAAANPLTSAKAMSTPTSSSADSNDGATITANDFLTLLVTEMQNQDPTADTDPNEYIDQLVNVNSLEQLIDINQTLSAAYPSTSTTGDSQAVNSKNGATSAATGSATGAAAAQKNSAHHVDQAARAAHAHTIAAHTALSSSAPATPTHGNLGTERARPAALRVARALDGQRILR